jgi:hypothetical protein
MECFIKVDSTCGKWISMIIKLGLMCSKLGLMCSKLGLMCSKLGLMCSKLKLMCTRLCNVEPGGLLWRTISPFDEIVMSIL